MKLSDQALSCVMVALQKSLMEQSDIVPVIKGFDFIVDPDDELVVVNPPQQILFSDEPVKE
jgi:hypothetical protein